MLRYWEVVDDNGMIIAAGLERVKSEPPKEEEETKDEEKN